jgi:hypothetical protein
MPTNLPRIVPLAVIALAVMAILPVTGCQSTGTQPPAIDTLSAAVRPIAKNVVNVVLARNPRYDSALLALAAGADAALNGGQLTPASIRAFVDALALKYDLAPDARLYIASAIDDLVKFYQDTYGQSVADVADPNVRKILTAFATGIRDGITFFHALNDRATARQTPPVPRSRQAGPAGASFASDRCNFPALR